MKLLKFADWQFKLLNEYHKKQTGEELEISHLATNKDILASVKQTCEQFHRDCATCPYWLENKFTCVFGWCGKDCLAYNDYEIEEKII